MFERISGDLNRFKREAKQAKLPQGNVGGVTSNSSPSSASVFQFQPSKIEHKRRNSEKPDENEREAKRPRVTLLSCSTLAPLRPLSLTAVSP